MRFRGIACLAFTVLLCTPSLAGGAAIVWNFLLRRPMAEWSSGSSASVAAAVFLGGPLVTVAVAITAALGWSRSVPTPFMNASYIIVSLAAISTLALVVHFGM